MRDLLFKGNVVRKIFARMRLSNVDDKEFEPSWLVAFVKLCEWRNLPHKRRSGYGAELQEYMLLCPKVRQGNFLAIEIHHDKGRRLCSDFSYGEEIGRAYFALPITFVIVGIHNNLRVVPAREGLIFYLAGFLSASYNLLFMAARPF